MRLRKNPLDYCDTLYPPFERSLGIAAVHCIVATRWLTIALEDVYTHSISISIATDSSKRILGSPTIEQNSQRMCSHWHERNGKILQRKRS